MSSAQLNIAANSHTPKEYSLMKYVKKFLRCQKVN